MITLDQIIANTIADSVIFTNSLSIVHAIANYSPLYAKNEIATYLKEKFYMAHMRGLKMEIIWIPAHRGIYGNETADFLAKLAIGHGSSLDVRIPYFDLFPLLRKKKIIASTFS